MQYQRISRCCWGMTAQLHVGSTCCSGWPISGAVFSRIINVLERLVRVAAFFCIIDCFFVHHARRITVRTAACGIFAKVTVAAFVTTMVIVIVIVAAFSGPLIQ